MAKAESLSCTSLVGVTGERQGGGGGLAREGRGRQGSRALKADRGYERQGRDRRQGLKGIFESTFRGKEETGAKEGRSRAEGGAKQRTKQGQRKGEAGAKQGTKQGRSMGEAGAK